MRGVFLSGPRVAAAFGAAGVLVLNRLWIEGSLREGSPLVAIAILVPLMAAGIYLLATLTHVTLAPVVRRGHLPPGLADAVGIAIAIGGLAVLSSLDRSTQIAIGLAMGGTSLTLALGARALGAPIPGPIRGWMAATGVFGGFVVLPALYFAPHSSTYDVDLQSEFRSSEGIGQVVLVGIDGADWPTMRRLIDAGRLPAFATLERDGVALPLRTLRPTSSPFLWNALYTGYTPALHDLRPIAHTPRGTLRIATRDLKHVPDPIDGVLTALGTPRVRYPFAMWDLLHARGYRTSVIGAWENVPVPHLGHVFSAVGYHFPATADPDRRLHTHVSPSLWGDAATLANVANSAVSPIEIPAAEWQALIGDRVDVSRIMNASIAPGAPPNQNRLARLRNVYASDRIRYHLAGSTLARDAARQFVFVYFRGVDVVAHCFLHLERGEPDVGEADLENVVENYYLLMDRWLADLRSRMRDDGVLLVVSDHGFDPEQRQDHRYKTGFHDHAPDGVFFSSVRRPDVALPPSGAHILDIAPTVLALTGLPFDAGMEGRVLEVVTPRTFGVTDWWSLEPADFERGNPALTNPELESFLKSLGYL